MILKRLTGFQMLRDTAPPICCLKDGVELSPAIDTSWF